ncbi:MAG: hypothetical protein ACKV2T_33460 [Kofleriaceae bacterium]
MQMRLWVIALGLVACSDELVKPDAPGQNDPAYQVDGVGAFYVVPDPAATIDQTMTIFVTVPAGTDEVAGFIGDFGQRFSKQPNGQFAAQFDLTDLVVGEHEVVLSANNSSTGFGTFSFKRSAPYYVLVTTDWDFADPGQQALIYHDHLHTNHPGMRITHFPGPYTFTDPSVTPARAGELVAWLNKQKTEYNDEIGLHIHPYCNFVESAGLTCITDQSTVYTTDTSGYTIKLAAYGRENMRLLLEHAKTLFQQNGLPVPRTFRAGGWTASLETVAALDDAGFIADTSALNWKYIEGAWGDRELYRWNMENWAPINDTSQPYYPSESNVLASDDPTLDILEVPDNGVMIDYTTVAQLNGIFDANWSGEQILEKPTTLMMGFHPAPGFSEAEFIRVNDFLKHADRFLASKRTGPVVYVTLEDVVRAFPN